MGQFPMISNCIWSPNWKIKDEQAHDSVESRSDQPSRQPEGLLWCEAQKSRKQQVLTWHRKICSTTWPTLPSIWCNVDHSIVKYSLIIHDLFGWRSVSHAGAKVALSVVCAPASIRIHATLCICCSKVKSDCKRVWSLMNTFKNFTWAFFFTTGETYHVNSTLEYQRALILDMKR